MFLSNGPGDPRPLDYAIGTIQNLLGKKPIFGICLGHQLLGRALGAFVREMRALPEADAAQLKLLDLADHRYEAHGDDLASFDALASLGQDQQILEEVPDRDHQPAPLFELIDEWLRHRAGRRSHHDSVERGRLRPTLVAIADA